MAFSQTKAVKISTFQAVKSIKVSAVVRDATGTVKITDLMLQGGEMATAWQGHPSEIKWSMEA